MDKEIKEAIERYDLRCEKSRLDLEFEDEEESETFYEWFESDRESHVPEGDV